MFAEKGNDKCQNNSLFSDLPSSGPTILGVNSKYSVGDSITASCVSPLSYPPTVLSWYINNDSADNSFVSNQSEITTHHGSQILKNRDKKQYYLSPTDTSLYQHYREDPVTYSVKKLNFIVNENHLTDGELNLKCTAEILDLYWRSNEVATQVSSSVPYSWYAPSFSYSGSDNLCVSDKLLCFVAMIYLRLLSYNLISMRYG